ncbi:GtrA family protein [Parerythrobacter aurantius]|uniref:GtrA family protein n=1 Tax=Parerythrobacter aurantius TaxID=3127706 RepID=UPI00324CBC49
MAATQRQGTVMLALLTRIKDIVLVRYLLASVGALAIDLGSFMALLSLGVAAVIASAAGYALGILAHWLLSSRKVFSDRVAGRGAERTKQKALFVVSALAGLALTTAIVGAGDLAGMDPRIAKLFAVAASFTLTWILRSRVVFRTGA